MEKIYKVIAVVAVIMCIVLMTWNIFLIKENTDLIKDNVSVLIKTIKQNDDHIDNQLGPITKNINLILTRLDKQEEFNKTVLVALANIYTMEYSKRFRYKPKENEIRNGEHDDFPNFFKERISNNHE